ncbi:hypothetical protein HK096_001140, partial [Nowakowskiella sp. JEL0078]
MPFLVLAAQLCPTDIEATFFATITSLHNAGINVSTRWGGALLNSLDVVRDPQTSEFNFSRLDVALWIRVGTCALGCLFVFLLPNSSLVDSNEHDEIVLEMITREVGHLETESATISNTIIEQDGNHEINSLGDSTELSFSQSESLESKQTRRIANDVLTITNMPDIVIENILLILDHPFAFVISTK